MLGLEHGIPSRSSQRLYGTGAAANARSPVVGARRAASGSSTAGGRAPAIGQPVGRRIARERAGWTEEGGSGRSQAAPERSGSQENCAGLEAWKKQRWPELKKRPKKKAGPSSSSTKAD